MGGRAEMNLILVVGSTGQGKSTFVKNTIKGKNCLVFDVNNEYPELGKPFEPRGKFVGLPEEFLELCFKRANSYLVFEEATGFLKGAVSKDMQRLIIEKRHKNNNLIFIFHSINRIPPAIFELSNFCVLHKTADNPKIVENKYPALFKAFEKLQKAPKFSKLIIKTI